jgi:hypothetical protein
MEPKDYMDIFEIIAKSQTQMTPTNLTYKINLTEAADAACVNYSPGTNDGILNGAFIIQHGTKLQKKLEPKLKEAYLSIGVNSGGIGYNIGDIVIELTGLTGKTVSFKYYSERPVAVFPGPKDHVLLLFRSTTSQCNEHDYELRITISITDKDRLATTIANF